MRILIFVLFLVVLTALLIHKGPREWNQDSLARWYTQILGQSKLTPATLDAQTDLSSAEQDKQATGSAPEIQPTPVAKPRQQKVTMYQWRDDKGQIHVTQEPPDDREYKELTYRVSEAGQGKRPAPSKFKPMQQPVTTNSRQSNEKNLAEQVGVECQFAVKQLLRYEKKLNAADNVADSIWLHDYCEALSELITNDCRLSKSDIKYNRYCPLRYRR